MLFVVAVTMAVVRAQFILLMVFQTQNFHTIFKSIKGKIDMSFSIQMEVIILVLGTMILVKVAKASLLLIYRRRADLSIFMIQKLIKE
jgi:hypothetical protein